MTTESQNYKLEILEYAVNQSINRLLSKSSEDALSVILYQNNEVVWRVATDIYTKSGHQVDFLFIRDLLNLRIEPLRNKIAEQARIKAELEAQRLVREAEQAGIRAELEAQRLAREAEQARIEKEKIEKEQKKLQEFKKAHPNIDLNDYIELETFLSVFVKIENIIVEELELTEEHIKLDSILSKDLGIESCYDSYFGCCGNRLEIAYEINNKFDMNIFNIDSMPEEENFLDWNVGQLVYFVVQKI